MWPVTFEEEDVVLTLLPAKGVPPARKQCMCQIVRFAKGYQLQITLLAQLVLAC